MIETKDKGISRIKVTHLDGSLEHFTIDHSTDSCGVTAIGYVMSYDWNEKLGRYRKQIYIHPSQVARIDITNEEV